MVLRSAEKKDLNAIINMLYQVQAVHANARPDVFKMGAKKYTEEDVLNLMADKTTPIYVAVDETDLAVGYAFCEIQQVENSRNLQTMKTFYIDDLCVDEKFRGKGIGRKLYEFCLKTAKELKCYHLTLNVWRLNESAERFYEKMGMKVLKTTMETIL